MATGSTALQNLVQNVYASGADLSNGQSKMGANGYNYIDLANAKPGQYTAGPNDIILGGSAVTGGVNAGNALRLWGADRNGTASAIQSYANQKVATVPQATDNSAQINDMYANQLASAQAALKASIQQSMGQYQNTIAQAPQQYQPLRDQASAAGANNMQNLQELLANNGQQGGVNRTESTAVNSATENNINSLNQQQQGVIDTANKAIADLQAQGDIKGAQLVADNASAKIQALINESNRVSTADTAAQQQTFQNGISLAGLTGNYNGQQTMAGKQSDASIANTQANTVYQKLVNAGYPAEEAAKLSQSQAQTVGQNLQNAYQKLVNAGYPANQAMDLAVKQAQINASNRSGSGGSAATAKASATAQKTNITNSMWDNFYNEFSNGTAAQFLKNNQSDLINIGGSALYNQMNDYLNKNSTAEAQLYNKAKNSYAQQGAYH